MQKLISVLVVICLVMIIPLDEAFAGTLQPDNYGLPDAFVNYNSTSNESTITWDFSGLPDYTDGTLNGQPAKCIVKSDYYYNNNPVTNPDLEITSFNPLNYIPIDLPAITGAILTSIIDSNVKGLEIPCTGQYTIDWDSVMNNAANDDGSGGSYVGVEPFISFYVMTSNEEFDTSDGIVVDEILIMYHPTAIEIDQVTVDWACGSNDFTDDDPKDGIDDNQIAVGNVLFIDQSGIRGTGGPNNCDTVVELDDLEYCCIFVSESTPKKNGSGSSSPPPPPTFGKDTNYKQIVTDGFCFNGNCVDVVNYHTEFPLINATVGETSNITLKAYNPSGINSYKWFQINLGLEEAGQPRSEAEVSATFYIDQTKIDRVEMMDDKNLIGNYTVSTDIVQCSEQYYSTDCLELSFDFIPRDQLVNNVVAGNVLNKIGASSSNYFNDGVEFLGDSLNEPLISYVAVGNTAFYPQDRGIVELKLISYHDGLWQDTFGYLWKVNNYGFYIISDIPVPIQEPDVMWQAMTRMNNNFPAMIIFEQDKAILYYPPEEAFADMKEPFSYDTPKSAEQQQAELDLRITNEIDRVTPLTKDYTKNQHLYQKDSYDHWNYFGDMTLAEINALDLAKKLALQDELFQQRLDDKAKYG